MIGITFLRVAAICQIRGTRNRKRHGNSRYPMNMGEFEKRLEKIGAFEALRPRAQLLSGFCANNAKFSHFDEGVFILSCSQAALIF